MAYSALSYDGKPEACAGIGTSHAHASGLRLNGSMSTANGRSALPHSIFDGKKSSGRRWTEQPKSRKLLTEFVSLALPPRNVHLVVVAETSRMSFPAAGSCLHVGGRHINLT